MRLQIQNPKTAEWDTITEDGSLRIINAENGFILLETSRLTPKGDVQLIRLRLNAREVNWFYQRAAGAGFYQQSGGGVLPEVKR